MGEGIGGIRRANKLGRIAGGGRQHLCGDWQDQGASEIHGGIRGQVGSVEDSGSRWDPQGAAEVLECLARSEGTQGPWKD